MRPLNMPGSAATVVSYRGEAYWRAVDRREKPVLKPVILEPAGRTVLWITQTPCVSALAFRDKALEAGWWAGMSYSRILDVPPDSGKYRGIWVDKEFVAVRIRHAERRLAGFGMWRHVLAEKPWAYDSGGMLDGQLRWLDFEELTGAVLDVPAEQIAERKEDRARRRAEKRAAKDLTDQVQ